ncbi:cytochrome b/b6 domain-containing protein [Tropicimonas sp. TH_r6]|uniref:cytochrome b/b6 domain-containing protein n=1 Tax=Tropicimonas sp. TH_r6 TaxID=3082085 RepID=UPI0029541A59|nr:cytochrome b/b6 domain-containing protein [Tropicimonas sp. TH_r6]MDV7142265.1 cytochrome b/b6 domain-containing protein [Tropicimonas sp. TH_r6]
MRDGSPESDKLYLVRLWDPFVRVFHWLLAICVIVTWLWGQFNPTGFLTLHFWLGYTVIGLLVFRLVWGLVGPWPARFVHFIYGPGTYARYISGMSKRKPSNWPGHNPVGALSVYLLLGVLALQVFSGLFADPEDYINAGPLADDFPGMVKLGTEIHHTLAPIILLLVVLHLGAVAFYKIWKRENLIPSMLHGRKVVKGEVPAGRIIEEVSEEA